MGQLRSNISQNFPKTGLITLYEAIPGFITSIARWATVNRSWVIFESLRSATVYLGQSMQNCVNLQWADSVT